jgi:hypothetical protein
VGNIVKVDQRVIAEKTKICSYFHVGKNSLSARCFLKARLISSACRVEFI